jgi:hypothetical protein
MFIATVPAMAMKAFLRSSKLHATTVQNYREGHFGNANFPAFFD